MVSVVAANGMDDMAALDYGFDASPAMSFGASSPYSFHGDSASVCASVDTGFGLGRFAGTAGPWLLGRASGPSPMLVVKNTFISVQEDVEDEGAGAPMVAAKSCPAMKMPDPATVEQSPFFGASFSRFSQEEAGRVMVQYVEEDGSPDASPAYVLPRELAASLRAASSSPTASSTVRAAVSPDVRAAASDTVVKPLEIRVPEMSFGSEEHGAGECRPCAWFWRPQGCANGAECRHCHLCPQGEVKTRRKSKITCMRKQGRLERSTSAPDSEHPQTISIGDGLSANADGAAGRMQLQLTGLV